MVRVHVERSIAAPVEDVFRAVTDIENLPATNADVVRIEFLGEQKSGLGTRFRDVRRMGKKEVVTDLEITEFEENQKARMVADSHGTVWDTLFVVRPENGATVLEITMDARAHKFMPRLMNPVMKGLFRKGISTHMDQVKAYCER